MRAQVTCSLCHRLVAEVTYTFGAVVVHCHFCPVCDRLLAKPELAT